MRKKGIVTLLLTIGLLVSPISQGISTANTPASPKEEKSIIYQFSQDGKSKKIVAELPPMHRASISPSGRFIYAEQIGYEKNDPTIPYLYDIPTKKMVKLSGFAKWSFKTDDLFILENQNLIRYNPLTGEKKLLVSGSKDYPIVQYSISPDERYVAFIRSDTKSSYSKERSHLYIQDLQSLKIKQNDKIEMEDKLNRNTDYMYWAPTSKKLFYQTKSAMKELDMPTGLKYTYNQNWLPSYSSDMLYTKKWVENKGETLFNLKNGKATELGLSELYWAPTGHSFVSSEWGGQSNSQDTYRSLALYKEPTGRHYLFDQTTSLGRYLSSQDNIQFIGWAKDGKSFYVADLSSTHYSAFSPGKLDEYLNVIEP